MNGIIKKIKEKIKESEKRTVEKFNEEEDITARLLENLERDFREIDSPDYEIKTKIFKRKGPKSEESKIGADFAIILDLTDESSEIRKFFLAQSKKCSNKNKLRFDTRLKEQCKKMIRITSDSFIFVYTKRGIYVKSALNQRLSYKKLRMFFEDFLNCFIGEIHYSYHEFPYASDKILFTMTEKPYKIHILEISVKQKPHYENRQTQTN